MIHIFVKYEGFYDHVQCGPHLLWPMIWSDPEFNSVFATVFRHGRQLMRWVHHKNFINEEHGRIHQSRHLFFMWRGYIFKVQLYKDLIGKAERRSTPLGVAFH